MAVEQVAVEVASMAKLGAGIAIGFGAIGAGIGLLLAMLLRPKAKEQQV